MLAKLYSALLLLGALSCTHALSSTLQQLTNFGTNPSNVGMYYYKPSKVASPTPIIVAMHYCTGTAQAYFQGTSLAQLADTHGFLVLYPNSPRSGGCWDVNTNATLTHNGGSDSLGIVNAVRYVISNMGGDSSRVFATGSSSGAMMTSVMMGAYPDVFKAGSAYSGVPYACFQGASDWNSQCSQGQLVLTAQQWGDRVRAGYPGYTGARPKIQFYHGSSDTTLYPQNFFEEIKQWTNVFGVSSTPTSNQTGVPLSNYWTADFGPNIEAIYANGVGHTVPEREDATIAWFGLSSLTPGSTGGGSTTSGGTTPPTTTSTGTTPTTGAGTAQKYGQCGGIGWTGATACVSGTTCTKLNDYYSQCL